MLIDHLCIPFRPFGHRLCFPTIQVEKISASIHLMFQSAAVGRRSFFPSHGLNFDLPYSSPIPRFSVATLVSGIDLVNLLMCRLACKGLAQNIGARTEVDIGWNPRLFKATILFSMGFQP
ncbi:hypothetical protein AVEN_56221-1 [Araneus ventricosus]|uniref:Uncharacterized protein n=1 Tax=Araneus ventricosus TaxID=182803 RepID=A0A4Y2J1S1_ARAVE|nr:hypothetical protein AVEN_56221-1 [Araneus ventricosus]